jgi:UDP-sugar transporter A1/2/3
MTSKKKSFDVVKVAVLIVLCLQNSVFTVTRRYSQGVLKESYSKHEVLLFGEIVKMIFSAYMIRSMEDIYTAKGKSFTQHIKLLTITANKMLILSIIYGIMNILSYIALRNISAGVFTICAQLKILTTATFSTLMLQRQYSWTKWRALISLVAGVLLFSEPIWNASDAFQMKDDANLILGTVAVLTEVTLSGFASIYFEKVIKTDVEQLNIWERNFQLALGSFPVYLMFIFYEGGGSVGYLGGWSWVTFFLAVLGAAGGLLVALSIKYGDAILKTLATTGSIVLSSVLDRFLLNGPLTWIMTFAGVVVITSICDYTFDSSPAITSVPSLDHAPKNDDHESESESFLDEEKTTK